MKSSRLISVILILLLALTLISVPAFALEAPQLKSARCAIIGEAETGKVLFEQNADEQTPPASVTKMMTLLLTVEAIERGEVSTDDMVTASANCRFDLTYDSSNAQIYEGERMSLKDLMYCAALASANEACNIIAEYIGGSISAFVDLMNARAAGLGCTGTHFANTHGLPDDEHYTTARDLFTIACEGMRHELFAELVGTATYTTAATNTSDPRSLKNSNALLTGKAVYGDKYYYEGAIGIKTGHTTAAGFCLASAAERDGIKLIGIVLGAEGDLKKGEYFDSFEDSVTLLDWVYDNFSMKTLVDAGERVGTVPVLSGERKGSTELITEGSVSLLLPNDADTSEYETKVMLYEEDGSFPEDKVGILEVYNAENELVGTVELIAGETEYEPLPEPSPEPDSAFDRLAAVYGGLDKTQLTYLYLACVTVLLAVVLGVAALVRRHRRKRR